MATEKNEENKTKCVGEKNDEKVKRSLLKLRRVRTAFTASQRELLEEVFQKTHYPHPETHAKLAQNLKLTEANVKIWFSNRRSQFKKDELSNSKEIVMSQDCNPSSTQSSSSSGMGMSQDSILPKTQSSISTGIGIRPDCSPLNTQPSSTTGIGVSQDSNHSTGQLFSSSVMGMIQNYGGMTLSQNHNPSSTQSSLASQHNKDHTRRSQTLGINSLGGTYTNGRPLPRRVRLKMVELASLGWSHAEISRFLQVTNGCVSKIIGRYCKHGSVEPLRIGGSRPRAAIPEVVSKIIEYRKFDPSVVGHQIRQRLLDEGVCTERNVPSISTINRVFRTFRMKDSSIGLGFTQSEAGTSSPEMLTSNHMQESTSNSENSSVWGQHGTDADEHPSVRNGQPQPENVGVEIKVKLEWEKCEESEHKGGLAWFQEEESGEKEGVRVVDNQEEEEDGDVVIDEEDDDKEMKRGIVRSEEEHQARLCNKTNVRIEQKQEKVEGLYVKVPFHEYMMMKQAQEILETSGYSYRFGDSSDQNHKSTKRKQLRIRNEPLALQNGWFYGILHH